MKQEQRLGCRASLLPCISCAVLSIVLTGCAWSKKEAREGLWSQPIHRDFRCAVERVDFELRFRERTLAVHAVRRSAEQEAEATMVFIHGYPSSLFTWAGVMTPPPPTKTENWEELSQTERFRRAAFLGSTLDLGSRFDLLAIDLPGHGGTEVKEGAPVDADLLDPATEAELVLEAIARLAPERPIVLVGHSFGGLVACYVLDRVRRLEAEAQPVPEIVGLALIDPEGVHRDPAEILSSERFCWPHCVAVGLGKLFCAWKAEIRAGLRDASLDRRDVTDAQVEVYSTLILVRENYQSARTLVDRSRGPDHQVLERVGSWPGKVLIVWGDRDAYFPMPKHPGAFRRLFARGPEGERRFEVIHGAGHNVPEDAPADLVNLLMTTF